LASHSENGRYGTPDSITRAANTPDVISGGKNLSHPEQTQTSPMNWRDHFKSVGELEQGDVRMLIDGFLPEGTTFIGGLPGEGKTLLALSMAKALTTGDPFLGKFFVNETVPVIYLIPESGGRAFRTRCEKFGIPNDPELFLCRTVSEGSTLGLDDASLIEAIRKLKPVVILDTIIRFSEAQDENQAMQNKQLVDDIIRLRQAGAVAVIGLHHATKAMREKGFLPQSDEGCPEHESSSGWYHRVQSAWLMPDWSVWLKPGYSQTSAMGVVTNYLRA